LTYISNPLAAWILVRLAMPGKTPPAPAAILKDLAPLFGSRLTKERVTAVLNELRAAGMLPAKGQVLTDAGRSHALATLGLSELPPKCNWGMIKAKYLVPKALGLTPWSEAEIARVNTADKLAARLLKAKYELPITADAKLKDVLEALVCKLAGFPGCGSFKELTATVISRELQVDPPLSVKDAPKLAPRLLLDAKKAGVDGYRMQLLAGLFEDRVEPSPEPAAEPMDLQTFAELVRTLAPSAPTGWTGDDLLLISHVWNHVHGRPEFQAYDNASFKEKLVEANRARLLTLSRADLIQALDPQDVRESEVSYLDSVFHFLKIQKGN
jgi:hypothetical protein